MRDSRVNGAVWRGGISIIAMMAGLAAGVIPAQAIDLTGQRERLVDTPAGAAGTDADWAFWWWNDDVHSGPGQPGSARDYTNHGTIGASTASGSAVLISSTGGRGGNGDRSLAPDNGGIGGAVGFTQAGTIVAGPLPGVPLIWLLSQGGAGGAAARSTQGGNGGAGGVAAFTQTGSKISATAPQEAGTSLVWVRSLGGNGAAGLTESAAAGSTSYSYMVAQAGAGGAGGTASAAIGAEIAADGKNLAAVRVTSQGGASGEKGAKAASDRSVGRGGPGGSALLEVRENGKISTRGDHAPAVIVESRAGSGGKAGVANDVRGTDGGSFFDSPSNPSVRVSNRGAITTEGAQAAAIVAQSVGGDGGDGNSTGATGSATHGGDGGAGGRVVVEQIGTVTTLREDSYGIVAQSVGGSGGRGGNGGVWGADGGRAGAGGSVLVTNSGSIETEWEGSTAIVAQSIGGGKALDAFNARLPKGGAGGGGGAGGSGGFLFFGSGGQGGGGGDGGEVEVRNGGSIVTMQPFAFGVMAQSIGGGGGDGGVARSFGTFGAVSLGGGGGGGGHGGRVKVGGLEMPSDAAPPSVTTYGNDAIAVFAQSVGGAGGVGGTASANSAGIFASVSVAIGGGGGKGGSGGVVEVDNTSVLSTEGPDAVGIFAQSIGGGGGRAGDSSAYALALVPPQFPGVSVTTTIGGTGGDGGSGGSVTVTNRADITTKGTSAIGVQAQSVGGGGGAAGSAISTSDMLGTQVQVGVPVAIGGTGGGGGNGDAVRIENKAAITTEGQFAFGISAASIGGGGGSGGAVQTSSQVGLTWDSLNGSVGDSINDVVGMLQLADTITANIAVGGKGGKGGFGGAVTVENDRSVLTKGSNATAIFAQSIGGGGGSGGGFVGGGHGTLNANVDVGGRGGDGGAGGRVTVTNSKGATITTEEAGSHGIYAQSVGGGGGVGGGFTGKQKGYSLQDPSSLLQLVKELLDVNKLFGEEHKFNMKVETYKNNISEWEKYFFDKDKSPQRTLAAVKTGMSLLKTMLDEDKSIGERLARSAFIGGLKALQLKNKAKIDGFNESIKNGNAPKLPQLSVNVAVGGNGGKGGAGGSVKGENAGAIETKAETSFGMFLQSVGGGGGAGGGAYVMGESPLNIDVTIGGKGKDGGDGGTVDAVNSGSITTRGELSYGILAQSVGGGGGVGGASGSGDGLSVSGHVTVGGSSGTSAKGGTVNVRNTGEVTTKGREAHAIVAQSVGGGGGVFYVHQADPKNKAAFFNEPSDDQKDAAKQLAELLKSLGVDLIAGGDALYNKDTTVLPKAALNINVGGGGGAGGRGDAVNVFHGGHILTEGTGSFGIFAQSLGGGGGLGGRAGGGGFAQFGIGVGGEGGTAGNGGAATVTLGNEASIETRGDNAMAIFAQSVGGGGGYGGLGEIGFIIPGYRPVRDGGSSGDGGAVSVVMDPDAAGSQMTIETGGSGSHGILAQSLGGGGGLVLNDKGSRLVDDKTAIEGRQRAVGAGGAIKIDTRGSITTTGAGSFGILAQSGVQEKGGKLDPNRKGGNITVDHAGTISGGSGTGGAIRIDGGAENKVTLAAGSTVSALSNMAISATFGRETVENFGTLIGDVDLVAGGSGETNQFINRAGATYRSAPGAGTVRLGTGGGLLNEGSFDLGGEGILATAKVSGDFRHQGSSAALLVDVASGPSVGSAMSDRLDVTGTLALNGGSVRPYVGGSLRPESFRVAASERAITGTLAGDNGVVSASAGSPFLWSGRISDRSLEITPRAAFVVPAGQSATLSEQGAMQHLQRIWDSGTFSEQNAAIFGRFARSASTRDYLQGIDSISPEESASVSATQTLGARTSMQAALSCPVFEGSTTLMQETSCSWARIVGSRTVQTSSTATSGYEQDAMTYRIGLQSEVARDWFFGATAGFAHSRQEDPDGFSRTHGNAGDLALSLKRQIGPWQFAASGHFGYGQYKTDRIVDIGPSPIGAAGTSRVLTAGARLRASHEFALQGWYVKPYADLDLIYTHLPSFAETGSQITLRYAAAQQWNVAISPALEIGGRVDLTPDLWLRPYATAGVTYLAENVMPIRVSLSDTGAVPDFVTRVRVPGVLANLGAGAQLYGVGGYELRAEYKADVGQNYLSQEVSARFSARF